MPKHVKILLASAMSFSLATSPLSTVVAHAQNAPSAEAPGASTWQKEFDLWRSASRSGTAKDYAAYLKAYPNGKFASVAKRKLDALNSPETADASKAVTEPADAAKTDEVKTAATDEAADDGRKDLQLWREVSKTGTEEGYRKYLKAFPKGKFAKVAQTRIDAMLAKAKAPADDQDTAAAKEPAASDEATTEDMTADTAPDSANDQQAAQADPAEAEPAEDAQAADAQDAGTPSEEMQTDQAQADQAEADQPETDQAQADQGSWEQEYALWKEASNGNTVAEYEAYLSAYPKGKFAAIAQSRIVALAAAEAPVADVAEGDEQPDAKQQPDENAANNDQQPQDAVPQDEDMANANEGVTGNDADQTPRADQRAAQLSEGTPEIEDMILNREARHEIQGRLTSLGYDTAGTDGSFGPRSRNAISAWQQDNGAPVSGYLSEDQVALIRQQSATAYAQWLAEQPVVVEKPRPRRDKVIIVEERRNPAVDAAIAVGVLGVVVGATKFNRHGKFKRVNKFGKVKLLKCKRKNRC
ncbi:hypothetical protein ABID20_003190 [Rhizobium alvei]|uniref:Peptidoglycan-binding domain-containing protein n=2 Tax=Rhizobium alvei TaxID=1132659 RepID=A0ABT8YHY3_9HYPH|nr:peptidoglycan-binding domain-containing protein [Rhizobium alvei]